MMDATKVESATAVSLIYTRDQFKPRLHIRCGTVLPRLISLICQHSPLLFLVNLSIVLAATVQHV